MAAEVSTRLPDDCWEMIFDRLNHESDWDSVSLVCKQFLLITNSLKVSLAVITPSIRILSGLLQRFPNLKKIRLNKFPGELDQAVLEIAQSRLNLEDLDLSSNGSLPTACLDALSFNLKNLKVLNCSSSSLTDADLVRIANYFPQLEELQILASYFPHKVDGRIIAVTDEGIEYLSSKLIRLRKIDLSGTQYISDKSLISLSSNCAFLERIVLFYCKGVTQHGISFLLQNSHHLTSLVLFAHFKIESFGVEGSANSLRKLQSLRLVMVKVSDEFLYSIAKAHIPLTELTLSFCKNYTFTGISSVLQACQSLESLVLQGAEFLTNDHMKNLSPFLHKLTSIWLYGCPELSDSTFVMLTQVCPFLNRLEMGETSLGRETFNHEGFVKNFAITYLNLSSNRYLSNSGLKKLLSICPNVEKLNLSNCFQRDERLDVADVLESSIEIKNLMLHQCRYLEFSERDVEISKLERLVAGHSRISNEVLAMIGRKCPGLLHLDLEDCTNITEEGVKELARSCKRLRYLSLSACSNVNIDIIPLIATNNSSLRRIVSPSSLYPEKEEQKYFLQHGCLVSKGVDYEEFI